MAATCIQQVAAFLLLDRKSRSLHLLMSSAMTRDIDIIPLDVQECLYNCQRISVP